MSRLSLLCIAALASSLGAACHAPSGADSSTSASSGIAECPVCKSEGDLACLRVEIDESTPRMDIDGRTYYFCSEECRSDFQERPSRYAIR